MLGKALVPERVTQDGEERMSSVGDVVDVEMRFVVRHEAAHDLPDGCTREVRRLQWRRLRVTYVRNWVRKTEWDEWADVPLDEDA